ncbi:MAG: beta-ketoacyl-ACP synthase II [Candidatus Omnitrophota bacterium]|nr:beta-ketoacyl-ACP synthase II [Candidatus Omnitrophota bacterium]
MKNRVVVTGLGAITPVGNDILNFWQAILAGKSGANRITQFDAAEFDSQISAEVKGFDPLKYFSTKEARHTARFVQFGVVAAKEAAADAKLNSYPIDKHRMGVVVGSGIGSLHTIEQEHDVFLKKGPSRLSPFLIPMLIVNEAPGYISMQLGAKGPNSCVATACASGSHAIGDAFKILQRGDADVMIAGGTESCITPLGVGGFCALKALSCRNNEPEKASRPFERDRDGFVMAEGAGIVVLETLEHAQKRKARIYAEITGYGMSADAYHITAPDPEGDGAARAMELCLKDASLQPADISYINAHGTSTILNDKIETLAIKRVFKEFAKKIPVSSTKSMTGHLLGAAGGVEFIICVLAIRDNIIPPTINYEHPDPNCDLDYVPNQARKVEVNVCLSNSLGFGGHNASLIVKRFKE